MLRSTSVISKTSHDHLAESKPSKIKRMDVSAILNSALLGSGGLWRPSDSSSVFQRLLGLSSASYCYCGKGGCTCRR